LLLRLLQQAVRVNERISRQRETGGVILRTLPSSRRSGKRDSHCAPETALLSTISRQARASSWRSTFGRVLRTDTVTAGFSVFIVSSCAGAACGACPLSTSAAPAVDPTSVTANTATAATIGLICMERVS